MPAYGEYVPVRDVFGTALDMTVAPRVPAGTEAPGVLNLRGRDSDSSDGGSVAITSGSTTSGSGGTVYIVSGSGSVQGGSYQMLAGPGGATGGTFQIQAGDGLDTGSVGGSVFVNAGEGETGPGAVSIGTTYMPGIVTITGDGVNSKIGLHSATPVAQSTGWGSPTGTATKTAFHTPTVTTSQLAERLKAVIDYLKLRGDFGS